MIGLDTNVLVRYIMQDDPQQSAKANQLIEALDSDNPGFISMVCLIELYWVLTSCFALTHAQVTLALETLLRTKPFLIERSEQVARAVKVFSQGKADFADCLIERSAQSAGCTQTMTFDKGAAKYAGMTLLV